MSVMTTQALGAEKVSMDWLAIARMLGRAHRRADAENAPNEARTILHLAHAFADELATTHPQFDRERFIQAAKQAAKEGQS